MERSRSTVQKWLAAGVVVFAVLMQSSCGYSLAGRGSFLPANIKRIGIPNFTNNTSIFDLDRRVGDRVRAEFISRGKWVVVPDQTGVDAVVLGTITSVTLTPIAFNLQQQATRYSLAMTGSVEFKDLQSNKTIWSNPSMQYHEEFQTPSATTTLDVSSFFGQDANALDRLSTEFSRALVSAVLEAF